MFLVHSGDVPAEPVDKPGFSQMKARFLLTAREGCPRYALRLMEIGPGGCTSFHSHQEEHEMFFLEGEGSLRTTDQEGISVRPGDALLLMPCEPGPEYREGNPEDDLHRSSAPRENRSGNDAVRMTSGIQPDT